MLKYSALAFLVAGSLLTPVPDSTAAGFIQVTTRHDELKSDGDCSLREAVVSVNAEIAQDNCADPDPNGRDVIELKGGTYKLTIGPTAPMDGTTGDLEVIDDAFIVGKGILKTTVDANGIDRAFALYSESTLKDLSITGGKVSNEDGGGVILGAASRAVLDHVRVFENEVTGTNSDDVGGGIFASSGASIIDSEIDFNKAPRGGGLFATGSNQAIIERSTFHDNEATVANGGAGLALFVDSILENVTVAENFGESVDGWGIYLGEATPLNMTHATVAYNNPGNVRANGALTSANSIIAEPTSTFNCLLEPEGSIIEDGANLTDDDSCFTSNSEVDDVGLMTLARNGGFIETLGLEPTSPAIDSSLKFCVNTDARGVPRSQDSCDELALNTQDIGGYELVRCAKTIVKKVGTPGPDVMSGSIGNDTFLTLGGPDTVSGKEGNDHVCGGKGGDTLKGQAGKDKLLGEEGRDHLIGGADKDVCIGGPEPDDFDGCETKKS